MNSPPSLCSNSSLQIVLLSPHSTDQPRTPHSLVRSNRDPVELGDSALESFLRGEVDEAALGAGDVEDGGDGVGNDGLGVEESVEFVLGRIGRNVSAPHHPFGASGGRRRMVRFSREVGGGVREVGARRDGGGGTGWD